MLGRHDWGHAVHTVRQVSVIVMIPSLIHSEHLLVGKNFHGGPVALLQPAAQLLGLVQPRHPRPLCEKLPSPPYI